MKNLSRHTDLCELVTSLLISSIQMEEMSRLGWLIGLVKQAIWVDSLLEYFLYILLLSISKFVASSQPTIILIFLEDPVGNCACIHEAARLDVCLFRQCSFCHVHGEY
jgi:hypothetical protein